MADQLLASARRGALVAIEGGDGTGKGTLIAALIPALQNAGFDVLATREPGGTPEGLVLRHLLLPEEASWEPWAELLLMAAARVQHVERVIRPALAEGRLVVTDRFAGSTVAYQGAGRGLPIDAILSLHQNSVGGLRPALTVILDADPMVGLRRSRGRLAASDANEGRFEALDLAFHERVRASFLSQAAQDPAAHVVVDATRPANQVLRDVLVALMEWVPEGMRRAPAVGASQKTAEEGMSGAAPCT